MSTSRLRLQKISAFLTSSLADQPAQRFALVRLGATTTSAWVTVAAGEAGGDTVISFGFCRKVSASRLISGGMVAREEQRLARCRQQRDDPLDIGDEPHVEHAVGFVDHQDLDIVQQDLAALEQVEQAARRGDQHVDALLQRALLVVEASPPISSAMVSLRYLP